MNNTNTPPLYALTQIAETEGLETDWYQCYSPNEWGKVPVLLRYRPYNNTWIDDAGDAFHPISYLRPLPEGTRVLQPGEFAVTKQQLEDLIRETWEQCDKTAEEYGAYRYGRNGGYKEPDKETFITTKLAQMGE